MSLSKTPEVRNAAEETPPLTEVNAKGACGTVVLGDPSSTRGPPPRRERDLEVSARARP